MSAKGNNMNFGELIRLLILQTAKQQNVLKTFYDLEPGKTYTLFDHPDPSLVHCFYAKNIFDKSKPYQEPAKLDHKTPFKIISVHADLNSFAPYGYVKIILNDSKFYFDITLKEEPEYLFKEVLS